MSSEVLERCLEVGRLSLNAGCGLLRTSSSVGGHSPSTTRRLRSAALLDMATCRCHNFLDVLSDVRNTGHHFAAKNVTELRKGFASPFLLLVVSHDQLHEFASVDIRIARVLDVLDDLEREMSWQPLSSLRQRFQVADKIFAKTMLMIRLEDLL